MFPIEVPQIPGLTYAPGFLDESAQASCLRIADAGRWDTTLSRRTQQFGWRYDYRKAAISWEDRLGDLPDWLYLLGRRMTRLGWFDRQPEQVIINEYLPGQGIAMHTDSVWGPVVVTISLGDDWQMDFVNPHNPPPPDVASPSITLERGSALVLAGEARYAWRHGIAPRKYDGAYRRQRRVSLTFRTLPR